MGNLLNSNLKNFENIPQCHQEDDYEKRRI